MIKFPKVVDEDKSKSEAFTETGTRIGFLLFSVANVSVVNKRIISILDG